VDVVDLGNVETMLKIVESGDNGESAIPTVLRSLADQTSGLPVCGGHKEMALDLVGRVFLRASEEDQERFKKWLSDRPSGGRR
jgi:hypothetical protein